MLEKDIESEVCKYARKTYRAMALKFTSPQRRNVPDRIFLFPDEKILFIEFKAPRKTASKGQEREHTRLRDRGFTVYVVDDIQLGKKLIDQFVNPCIGSFWE